MNEHKKIITIIFISVRYCSVDGRGGFKKSWKFCPLLDTPDSKVECVIGVDR